LATVDLGKISFTQKGTYSNSTSYAVKDVVQHTDQNETSSFVKINSTATGQVPQTNGTINSSHWAIFAKGSSLASGNQGTYNASTTYDKGDVVQFTDTGVISTFLYINNTPASGQTPSTGGTVNSSHWQLIAKGTAALGLTVQSVKTANFNASAGEIYPCDTSSGSFTATLPTSPSVGDEIGFLDYARTFQTNKLILEQGSVNFQGGTVFSPELNADKRSLFIRYIDSTKGWIPTIASSIPDLEAPPTGQAEYTTPGSYNFTIPTGVTSVAVLCVGAGGGNNEKAGCVGNCVIPPPILIGKLLLG